MTFDYRVLVTGSRDWTDQHRIEVDLSIWQDANAVLITGACPTGADRIAEEIWTSWGQPIERYPADWKTHGKAAGPLRNAEMVNAGADICLAYIRAGSRGASNCADLAIAAGIVTLRRTEDDA